jgi:hypothetical protein
MDKGVKGVKGVVLTGELGSWDKNLTEGGSKFIL